MLKIYNERGRKDISLYKYIYFFFFEGGSLGSHRKLKNVIIFQSPTHSVLRKIFLPYCKAYRSRKATVNGLLFK